MTVPKLTHVTPLSAPLCGAISVPGDKSISHRAVLFSAMAEGVSHVSGILDSEDVRSSIGAVTALGAKVDLSPQSDGSLAGSIEGWGAEGPRCPAHPIDCGNSGTTARLLMGIIAPWDVEIGLTGDDSLRSRPMSRISGPLSLMGVNFPCGGDKLPLRVRGTHSLSPIDYESPVASAQLKTAVLLAGAFANGCTSVAEPSPSRDHTELMLPAYGVAVESGSCAARVQGPSAPVAADVHVPGDPSSAAFLVCAAVLVPGSCVRMEGVSLNPARIGFVRVLERMGADVSCTPSGLAGGEPCGIISARHSGRLCGCEVAANEIPSLVDEIPVLAFVAAHASGVTAFRGIDELRVKETDRAAAIVEGLSLLGIRTWIQGSDLLVQGSPGFQTPGGVVFESRKDHRLAMTWALAGLCGSSAVDVVDFESVSVSYPGFMSDIERLTDSRSRA